MSKGTSNLPARPDVQVTTSGGSLTSGQLDCNMRRRTQVDQQAFERLQCNRCGECCRSIVFGGDSRGDEPDAEGRIGWWHYRGPLGFLEVQAFFHVRGIELTSFSGVWFGQLIPTFKDGNWRYACQYLGDGAECTIYEQRPRICRDFPYGRPSSSYPGCVWDVEVVDGG